MAFLRAVNVGGHGVVPMSSLAKAVGDAGFSDVRTFLTTGNLVFRGPALPARELEHRLESTVRSTLGLTTDVILRSPAELRSIRSTNPFPEAAREDPSHLLVVFLKSRPRPAGAAALEAAVRGPERARVEGSHAYVVYPNGIGRSKVTLPLIERHLGVRGTARNWNTVGRVEALAGG